MNNNTKQKICPEEKEIDPNTGSCLKKCKDGFERDENFKCVKIIKPEEKTEDKEEEKSESSIYQPVDANVNTPNPILN